MIMKNFRKKRYLLLVVALILVALFAWFITTENTTIWPIRNTIQYHLLVWWAGPVSEPDSTESGALAGAIRNIEGRPIKGATVLVAARDGTTFSSRSGADGLYFVDGIPPGTYRPVAGAPGYESVQFGGLVGDVEIAANAQTEVDAALPIYRPSTVLPGVDLHLSEATTPTCSNPLESSAIRRQLFFNSGGRPNQPTFYYTPLTATTTSQLPLLLAIYPGPAESWQCVSLPLAAAGYAVLAAGPAYTFEFEATLDEMERLLAFAHEGQFPGTTADRVALLGGSYSTIHVQRLLQRGQENIESAVLLGPPTDLFDMRRRLENGTFSPPFGLDQAARALGLPDRVPLRYWKYSGAYHVAGNYPPVIIFHSRNDKIVPYQQSELLAANLDVAGAPNELYLFDGATHYLMAEGGGALEIFERALDFLAAHLK